MGELYATRSREVAALWNEGECTLIHGDDHIGNLFVDGDRTGFYDWAVASRFPGMRDVSYFLCNSLPARRASDRGGGAAGPLPIGAGQPRLHARARSPARAVPVVLGLLVDLGDHDGSHGVAVAAGRSGPPGHGAHDAGPDRSRRAQLCSANGSADRVGVSPRRSGLDGASMPAETNCHMASAACAASCGSVPEMVEA